MKLDITTTKNRAIVDFKKQGFKHLRVLGKYNYTKSEKELAEHMHKDMLEICFSDKGSQIFDVENEKHLVKGGDMFLHFPNEKHSSGGNPEEKGQLYWMIIDLKKINEDSELAFICNKIISLKRRHFKASKEIKKILEEIFTAVKKTETEGIKFIRINVLLRIFLLELLDCINHDNRQTDNHRLNKILNYINSNIATRIDIASLAKEINISESRFKTLFKELTGFTPGDYIQRKRIEKAVSMIKEHPFIALTDLAYELDFSSPQYFSTVMKKYTGKSPEAIKKELWKMEDGR